MNKFVVIVLIVSVLSEILLFKIINVKTNWRDKKQSNKSAIQLTLVYLFSFFISVCIAEITPWNAITCSLSIAFIIYIIYVLKKTIKLIFDNVQLEITPSDKYSYLKVIFLNWIAIFFSLSDINSLLFSNISEQYSGLEGMNLFTKGFYTLSYTFSLMITYSGDNIRACGILSRGIEMIEIIMFYIVIGIVISNIIADISRTKKLEKNING